MRLQPGAGDVGPLTVGYDTLIVAGGSRYSYFGHDEWRSVAPEVKSLESALEVRGRILSAFEAAEMEPDHERRACWLTFVVVGAGPTGVEMAGQIAELAQGHSAAGLSRGRPARGPGAAGRDGRPRADGFPPSLFREGGALARAAGRDAARSSTRSSTWTSRR